MERLAKGSINVVRKQLRDGSIREYFYDRCTGAPLGHDRGAAQKAVAARDVPSNPRSFTVLISRYLARPGFRKLAPRTRTLYRGYLEEMRLRYGDLLVHQFGIEAVEEIQAEFQRHPRKANQIIALFRILLSYAVKLRLIKDNPALRPGMLPTPPRTQVWSYAEEEAFLTVATSRLRLALMLLIYTAQRPGDVLAMATSCVTARDGRLWIALRQQKTGGVIELPVHDRLAPLLRERLSVPDGLFLVSSPTGRAWEYRNFARAWDDAAQQAGTQDRQRRDCRRTAVVRLADAGATVPMIAAMTGWGIDYCQRIVDVYLPRRPEVAASAIELWERAGAGDSRVVRIGLRQR